MTGYTKLFGSIVASTIWDEDNETRIVWITMLAMANKFGIVESSVPGLAKFARVPLVSTLAALQKFMSPDQYSRSKEHEGRRIAEVEGGWKILNHSKYRERLSSEDRREYLKLKQREYRWKKREAVNSCQQKSKCIPKSTMLTQAEAEAEACTLTPTPTPKRFVPPTAEEAKLHAAKIGLPDDEVGRFIDYYASNGWRVGRNPMKCWRSAMSGWRSRWEERRGNGSVPTSPEQAQMKFQANPRNYGMTTDVNAYNAAVKARVARQQEEWARQAKERAAKEQQGGQVNANG